MKQRLTASVLFVVFVCAIPLSAVDGDKAAYAGGTYLPDAAEKDIEGPLFSKKAKKASRGN